MDTCDASCENPFPPEEEDPPFSTPGKVACAATMAGSAVGFHSKIKGPWYSARSPRPGWRDTAFPIWDTAAQPPRISSYASPMC